jgi:hypothetical protein
MLKQSRFNPSKIPHERPLGAIQLHKKFFPADSSYVVNLFLLNSRMTIKSRCSSDVVSNKNLYLTESQTITITENIFHFNAVLERNTLRLQKNEVMRRMATRRDRCG